MPKAAPTTPSDRPIVAFFDVDNTLLRGASMYHLGAGAWRLGLITLKDILTFGWHQARFLAVGENLQHLSRIRDRALELVGGHTEEELLGLAGAIYDKDIAPTLWPETVELAREHLRKGHEVWLITATPQLMAQVISDRLGFTGALGTVLEAHDGVFSGKLIGETLHGEGKAVAARALARKKAVKLADCWAYSDSRNDIPLLTLVGHRIVVNPDASLKRHAAENGWPILLLQRASLREAQRRVRHEAKEVSRSVRDAAKAEARQGRKREAQR